MIEPVRPIALADIEAARERIAGTVLRTPLVRLDLGPGGPDIRLKLENLQPTNAYKIRGAANAVARLSGAERARGVWTVSAGNAGQGVAYAARAAGIPCTVVAIESAPQTKLDRMAALGARIVPVPYEIAWQAVTDHEFAGMDGTFIHPFDNHDFIAGHATMGLEILEDAPDVRAVITAIGGGGLITGVGSAIKALRPDVRVYRRRARDGGALMPCRCAKAGRGASPIGRRASSTAPAARASPSGCGSGCCHGRRRDHRHARADPAGDAAARREGAGDRRGRRRFVAGGGPDRRGGRGADRLRRSRAAISTSRNSASRLVAA